MGTKISELTALTTPVAADLMPIVDTTANPDETKKVTIANLFTNVPGVTVPSGFGTAIETLPYGLVKASGGAVGYTANAAHYLPVVVPFAITLTRIKIWVGTQSGNVDVGIYNSAGVRQVSSGTVACGTNTQTITIGTTTLQAGLYYMGITCDNATATFYRYDVGIGPLQSYAETSAFPLPATATLGSEAGEQYWMVGN